MIGQSTLYVFFELLQAKLANVTSQSKHVNDWPDRKSNSRLLTFVWQDSLSRCDLGEAVFVLFLEACKPALCHLRCLSALAYPE